MACSCMHSTGSHAFMKLQAAQTSIPFQQQPEVDQAVDHSVVPQTQAVVLAVGLFLQPALEVDQAHREGPDLALPAQGARCLRAPVVAGLAGAGSQLLDWPVVAGLRAAALH